MQHDGGDEKLVVEPISISVEIICSSCGAAGPAGPVLAVPTVQTLYLALAL